MQFVVISFAAKRKLVGRRGAMRPWRRLSRWFGRADTLYGDGLFPVGTGIGVWERHWEVVVPAWVERVRAPSLDRSLLPEFIRHGEYRATVRMVACPCLLKLG